MAVVGMKQLLEAGVHFGHQTRRWNPKMKPYIFTERNGIHIIDLQKTVSSLDKAYYFVQDVTRQGGKVLFVGTKKQAQEAVAEEASRAEQFYVNQRWLGGLLTNFQTIRERLRRLDDLEQMREAGGFDRLPKKEQLRLNDEIAKLTRMLGGIRTMRRLPQALFVVDTKKEHIAIHEARRLDIPVVALLDTNCDPDEVDYAIPANDDAIRAVRLLSSKIADAAYEGAQERASTLAKEEAEEEFELVAGGVFSADPEGYEAAIERVEPSDGLGAEPAEAVTVRGTDEDLPSEDQPAEVAADAPIAAAPTTEAREEEAGTDAGADRELAATAADALAGDAPPETDESGLGIHPDAEE